MLEAAHVKELLSNIVVISLVISELGHPTETGPGLSTYELVFCFRTTGVDTGEGFLLQTLKRGLNHCYPIKFQSRANMAVTSMSGPSGPSMELDDYSLCSDLSDDELIQLAIERSLDKCHSPTGVQNTPSPPSPVVQTQTNPNPQPRHLAPSRHVYDFPPANPPPPNPLANPTPAHPPCGPPRFIYACLKKDFSQLQSLIMNGDTEALINLVRRKSKSLTEPNDEGWIALHEAAYYGQLQCLRILIRAHPDKVNKCSLKSQTALLLAAACENVCCVEFLLEHGADPNIPNKEGETPLFKACEKPNYQIVEVLLKFGASVNKSCSQGATPLHEAARHGHVKICKILLEAGANLGATNVYGIQPFFTAAQNGNVDILNFFIRKGANINGQAGDGATPLYEASKNGHVTTVEMLLSHKADANRMMKSGLLPLHVAVQKAHTRIVSMLIPVTSKATIRRSGISPLHSAADRNRDEIMELLIEKGFEVNAELSEERSNMYKDRRRTALYFSVYNRNIEATEMLLEAGANPNLDWFNPLLIAVRQGSTEIVILLLKYGANVNAQISTNPSSFPSVVQLSMKCLPMLKLLLDNGCDALACFNCVYGSEPHPPITLSSHRSEDLRYSTDALPQHCVEFCEAISYPSTCQWVGPIVSVLLDYVGHARLCSRLLEHLDSFSDWTHVKLKAMPPHPLMQLCRLQIRRLVGIHRLQLLNTLPLPGRLIRFLSYDVQ